MRKMVFFLLVFFSCSSVTLAQEKIDVPVWNLGDKWVFTQGNIEVVGVDQNTYTLAFSRDICFVERKQFEKIVFDKTALNRIYTFAGGEREKYASPHRLILNFPFTPGKEWKDSSSAKALTGPMKGQTIDFAETFVVVGWEDVKVQGGDFKTVKLEYTQENKTHGFSGKAVYWYAPAVKYFVKCRYDQRFWVGAPDWELVSFKMQK